MEISTLSNRMLSLVALYDLHTGFFAKVLDGIDEHDTHKRLNTKANHIAWLAGSLVQQRYELAADLGIDKKQSAHDLFSNNKGIQEGITYPSLAVYKSDWDNISPELRSALINLSDEKLDSEIDMGGMKMSLYELVTFITYREANIIGQLALWRRLLGYDAMKYD